MLQLPRACTNTYHSGPRRHLTTQGQADCDAETLAILKAQRLDTMEPTEHWRTALEDIEQRWLWEERKRREREADEAARAHVREISDDPRVRAVVRNAERQLLGAAGQRLDTIGLLLVRDIYALNRLLRTGQPLTVGCGATLDWNGYTSLGQFFDVAASMFDELGEELDLDEPVRLSRGVGIPALDQWEPFDIWGIGEHLRTGHPLPTDIVTDPGFIFATPFDDVALRFDGTDSRAVRNPEFKVLLDLEVRRGLCISARAHRSTELVHRLHGTSFIDDTVCQVILPPGSRFRLHGAEAIDDGWTRVMGEQIV